MASKREPDQTADRHGDELVVEWVALETFKSRFVTNPQRAWLFEGLVRACIELRRHGCRAIYVGGSFVDRKEFPNDYDACFDTVGVSPTLDQCLFDSSLEMERRKKYRGDWLFGRPDAGPAGEWLRFLSRDRSGKARSLIGLKLNLKELNEQ
ncbi:MAG: hypothetical protein J7493_13300 [Porphyrobacter sp.]|nr:hypothetical protein [Porphyrobacter sp.]